MRDVTDKNKKINELVEQELLRLDVELDKNIGLLKKVESDISEIKNALEKSESNALIYKGNVDALNEEIDILK